MGGVVIAFLFSAQSTQQWTADQDYVLTVIAPCTTAAGNVLVTTDPQLTGTNISAPAANKILYDVLGYQQIATRTNIPINAPVLAGTTLFVSASVQTTVILYLTPVSQLNS